MFGDVLLYGGDVVEVVGGFGGVNVCHWFVPLVGLLFGVAVVYWFQYSMFRSL